jgi:hypothetical protein
MNANNFAPIALFAYARLEHLRRAIESLCANPEAKHTRLYLFCDGPKNDQISGAVERVRVYAEKIVGFASVHVVKRERNMGLAGNIIDGVTRLTQEYERVIVVEDDLLLSRYFLQYMNEALRRYAEDERVISIHGYVYPVKKPLPEAFFLPGADCWGWATWRRGWQLFNPNGRALLDELIRRRLVRAFDFNGAYAYSKMLNAQIRGKNDSWAVRWYASAFLAGKLTLYPGRSLVHNMGNDGSGTHCESDACFDAELSQTMIDLRNIEVSPSAEGRAIIEEFLRSSQTSIFEKLGGGFGWLSRMVGV